MLTSILEAAHLPQPKSEMHSTVVRAQNVFGFFTSVAFTVAAAIALSVALLPQSPQASLELKNVQVYAQIHPLSAIDWSCSDGGYVAA